VIQTEKFAQNQAANSGEFLDHHTGRCWGFDKAAAKPMYYAAIDRLYRESPGKEPQAARS